jgi:hypothetical protein
VDPQEKDRVGVSESPHSDSEEKEVSAWLRTIENTIKFRDNIALKSRWTEFVDMMKGDFSNPEMSLSIPLVKVPLVWSYIKTEVARMYFKDPWITVNAKRVEDLGAAQIAEQIVNYTWGELKLKQQSKLALQEAKLIGHSWIKVGYVSEFGTMESQPKPDEKRGPGRPPQKFKQVDTNEYIKSENVFAYYVPYKDIVFDPTATYPPTHNARWMAHKTVKPLRAIKQSGIYEHTEHLRPNIYLDDPNAPQDNFEQPKGDSNKNVRTATLWEIYDLDHQTVTTVSPGCKYKLREIPYPDYLNDGFPFVMLGFNPIPGAVYPMSDIAPQQQLIFELTKIMSIETNHLKRWNRQMIVDPDLFTPQEADKFKDANDGAMILSAIPGAKDKIFIPPYAPVQSDCYQVWTQAMDVWRTTAGMTAQDQGGQAHAQTRTLGELRMQLQGSKARSDESLDVFEDFLAEIARKLLAIMQKKYDLPKIARIVGPKVVQEKILKILPNRPSAQPTVPGAPPQGTPGQTPGMPGQPQPQVQPQPNPVAAQSFESEFGFSWNRQDILGEMDVDVLAGSTVPLDRESQIEIIEKMLPLFQLGGMAPGSPAAKELLRELGRLSGLMSIEAIIEQLNQQPPMPNPKLAEIQAKVQAKQQESSIKIQGMKAAETIKLQAAQQKLQHETTKQKMDIQKSIIGQILDLNRQPNGVNGGANGGAIE